MNCIDNDNKDNANGVILICDEISNFYDSYEDFLKDDSINSLVFAIINADALSKAVKNHYISIIC